MALQGPVEVITEGIIENLYTLTLSVQYSYPAWYKLVLLMKGSCC